MSDLTIASTMRLNNGVEIPRLGLGVYLSRAGGPAREAVSHAISCGYRHVDTAAMYGNEADVGEAIRACGIDRSELFVTTKLWNDDHGYDRALRAFDESLGVLGLEYIDLYLIHWPVHGLRSDSWRALESLVASGRTRAIGVSNYTVRHLEELLGECRVRPAVNQVEFSPFLYQRELLDYCRANDIVLEAYSPLTKGHRLSDPTLAGIGEKQEKSPAQILIRWALQRGTVVIPKSANAGRIAENAAVFDFALDDGDMADLDALDEDLHTSWDPTDAP